MNARLFIGYESALFFWLRGSNNLWPAEPCRVASLSKCTYNSNDVQRFPYSRDAFGPAPLHIMVDDPSKRRDTPFQKCHLWTTPLAQQSFVDIGHGIFVASPALCFIQAANSLSTFELGELGYELCGSYARTPGMGNGFIARNSQLTTPESIQQLMRKMPHAPGSKASSRIAPYIAQGSASPAETDMAMKNHLPPRMGGYGFPLAELNPAIEPTEEAVAIAGRSTLFPDALWEEEKVCLEYDSSMHHERREDRVRDSLKRNALGCMGYKVITVTPPQLQDVAKYHGVATEIAMHLGVRLRRASQNTLQKRYELNEAIKQRISDDAKPIEWPYC